jgi:peptide methionine sulfoxide reductase MsrB
MPFIEFSTSNPRAKSGSPLFRAALDYSRDCFWTSFAAPHNDKN